MKIKKRSRHLIVALVFILMISNFYGIPYVARAQASGPLDTIIEDTLEPAGKYVSFINSNGIGISEVDNSNGQWQYNAGGMWLSIVAPETGKIAVFGRDVMIRFVPKKDWNGTTQIKYRSWLASGESSGNYVNVNAEYSGDTESYSELEQAAQIVVTPVNDTPYISESSGSTYLDFDGKGYVTIPDLNIYTNSLTIETWVNASSAPTWARIFDTSYGPDNYNLHLTFEGSTGRIALEALPQKGARIKAYMVKTTEQLPLNQWVHVAAVYNAAEKKAYIYWNGILKGSGFMDLTDMANASAQNSNLPRPYNYIGESTWSQDANYVGGMRDYRIWKKAKTQAEIESQMNTSLTGSEANLMVNYKFNNANDGAVAKDSSTGVKNGNIISGKWQSSIGFNSNLVTSANTPVSKPFKLTDVDAGDVLTLTATSSNTSLLANTNITFSGEGSDRNINLTPTANMTGTSTITVTVNDGTTSSASSFLLSVVAGKFDLKSITPSVGVMTPAFNRGIIYNKVHVPNKSGNSPNNSIGINVAAVNPADVNVTAYADNGSGVTVSGAYPTFTVSGLAVGVYKPVKIKVADKFSTNFKEYQLDLIRYPGNDADLGAAGGLALSNLSGGQPIALSPAYSSNTGSYSATVENNVSSIKVDVIKSSLFAAATLNGASIGSAGSANATGNVSLAYGKNVISVVITAEDGKTQKTYTVTIVRKLSGDASLTNLTASPVGLMPVFSTNQSDYSLKVANAVTTAEFTPTAAAGAELKVNGIAHPSGTPFSITDLAAGNNKYQIEVTAQDGVTKKVYSLVILRAPSDVADLSGLSVSSGTLTPAFNNNETGYSVEVPYQVSSLDVTPKLLDAAASLSVDGNVHQDNTAFTKSLSVGLNTVKIVVTSQSGAREKTTLINIIRKASSNADLSNLVLSNGVLNPVYDKNQTGYAVTVANQVSELTITPTPEDLQATVSLNGNLTASAEPRLVNLQVGVNEFNVQVTAEDGVTSKNYVLTIVREASSDADLTNITLSGKPLSGGFDRATSTYYEYIANNITSMTVAATTSDVQATYTINGLQSAGGVPLQLVVGENKVTVVVTAADQSTTKEYTVTIVRAASSNANLLELTMTDLSNHAIALSPVPGTFSYNATVQNEISVGKLSPVVDDANASISVFVNGVWVEDLDALPLTTGLNVIEVRVTAQDGSMKMYTINLVRNPSADASLYNLIVSPGELTPDFQQGISDYSVQVDNSVSSMDFWINTNNEEASYTLKKNGASAGVAGSRVTLDEGTNQITVEVTAADSSTKKTYTVTVNRAILPKDSSLTDLTVSSVRGTETLNPEFSSEVFKYFLSVPYEIDQLELDAVKGDPNARITVNGVTVDQTMPIQLAEGLNIVNLKVTAQDGKTESVYELEVIRESRSSNADLSSIGTDVGALDPAFDPGVTNYTVEVESDVNSVVLTPVAADAKAESQITGRDGALPGNLVEGDNIFDIVVTAEDGTVKTYTVNVVKKASSNAAMSSLVLSTGVLDPVFDKNKTSYTVTVENQVSELTITPTPEDLRAAVSLNGNVIVSAQPRLVQLQAGVNVFNIQVTAEDGVTSKNYVLTIVRKASSDADLTNITLSGKPLSGGFDRATSTYLEYVANNVTSMTVAATTSDAQATYTINGLQSSGGVPMQLVVGENVVRVVVTAADQSTTKEYTVTIVRAASSNASLLELTMTDLSNHAIALSPVPDTFSYNATVQNAVSIVKLSPVVDDDNASITVFANGIRVEDLNAVPLNTGLNVIEVKVTAQDGSMKMYTINLVRNSSADASLNNLIVSPGELTPDFQQGISDYSVQVDNSVSSMEFSITTNNEEASYTLKKNGASAGVTGSRVTLDEGTNQITVEVTAADASTKKTYTVTVNRAVLPKDSSLSNLTVSSVRGAETLNPEFSSEVFKYFLSLPYEIDRVDLVAVKGDPNAQITVDGVTVAQTMLIQLAEGLNIVNLKVTAPDGKTESVYELVVARGLRSSDADLSSIGTDVGTLDPAFNPGVTNYTLKVESDVNSVVLTPVAADAKAGSKITGRDGALPANLVEGDNIFDIVVTAEDGTVKTYTVNVIKAKPIATPTPTPTPTATADPDPTPTTTEPPTATTDPTSTPTEEPIVTPTVEPTPATPAPETPAPATPAPETPAPATPAPETPAPATPAPETPALATPAPAPAVPAPVATASTEEITVKVESGQLGQGSVLAETVIQRTQDTGGILHDVVNFTTERVEEVVRKIAGSSDNTARIMIPDEKDQVADINVKVPKDAIKTLGDSNVNMEVFTENVRILIPQSSLDNFAEDLYFHVVPIKDQALRKEVEDRARIERIVREIAADKQIDVVARPMTIETNMQSRPVTLTLPLRDVQLPSGLQERQDFVANLVIFVEHSDGDKELIKATVVDYKTGELGLQFKVNKFSTFTILNMEGWEQYLASAESAQQQLAGHKAFINGFTDGTFKPDHSITRAEMAAILARNLGYDPSAPLAASSFPDVKDSHWAKGVIEFVKAAGLMQGNDKGQFLPDAPITRGEIAAIASRYKKLDTAAVTSSGYKDTDSHWAAKEIAAASKANIINGYGDGTYRPTGNLTRAEAVKVVNRLFGRGPLYGVTTPSWPDVPVTNWAYNEIEEASIDHTFTVRNEGGETLSQ